METAGIIPNGVRSKPCKMPPGHGATPSKDRRSAPQGIPLAADHVSC